jgi:hypothetical protein
MCRELTGDPRRALSHSIRALRLHRALCDGVREATELAVIGWHLACLGHPGMARAFCVQAIEQAPAPWRGQRRISASGTTPGARGGRR